MTIGTAFGTVVLTLWVLAAVTMVLARLLMPRWIHRALQGEPEDPARASAKEVAILVAREKYAGGDFRRAVVRRVPSDLFSDDLVLECGHRSGVARSGEEIPYADCYTCAQAWIEAETKAKLKV